MLSLGNDRLVKLWSLKGALLGVLKQGSEGQWPHLALRQGTETEKIFDDVGKNFEEAKIYKERLRKAKTVPFKKEDNTFGTLANVESKEIFKDLQEISRYLDKKQEQDQKLASTKKR